MRNVRGLAFKLSIGVTIALFLFAFGANAAVAKGLPADVCSLLANAQLQKTLGQPFGNPTKTAAPAAYRGLAEGTNCQFIGQRDHHQGITLIVYSDRSPSEAKATFEKLSMWYPPVTRPSGIGDSAYIDSHHAIHVLKGRVRFYIEIDSRASNAVVEKQEQELAAAIVAQI